MNKELADYVAIEERIRSQYRSHPELPFWLLTLNYGKRYTEAERAWCEEAAEVLRRLAAPEGRAEKVHGKRT